MNNIEGIKLKINKERIQRNILELGDIGLSNKGGVNRSLASQADIDSREWIKKYWQKNVVKKITTDVGANLWGDYPYSSGKKLAPIIVGSHNDSVPEGGKYDGALGVLLATEVTQTLVENKINLRHPLKVISLTGEEPNPYQISTLGSKIISGVVGQDYLKRFNHIETHEALSEAIDRLGGDFKHIDENTLAPNSFAAFLECHIEQGRRLFERNEPVAVVSKITGIYRELIELKGEANHAGTTDLKHRKDALLAMSWINLELRKFLSEFEPCDPVVGTIGFAEVKPNAANIIPGEVRFNIDVRSGNWEKVQQTIKFLDQCFMKLEEKGLMLNREKILNQKPANLNDKIIDALSETVEQNFGYQPQKMTSMAGHDAANLAKIGRSGMLFVKSIDGKSHCKEEYSRIEDIETAGNVLLNAILKLDEELD
ncbi:Zn-dependent hydrolase [Liquorilactobacillus mali]|uniref:Allantoate amidohydrolase n=1 Tax=Liquorilactobacillus mali KCTC 3596 = DSM 20444 TaxID=1046596 RepID=J1F503_9LACO|nr:Zn-dependent hydrolase [Liquorilactobacillus mali]EJF01040.1 allantoate amidohydrolase [Liquorilactobacillus mali KCTC 3596 = DSM 20444]KRN09774.1 allantoate amidohydrolase [Liquorilactobacillus mali KCTC 3596 = DSM 20444]MDC7953362.1 Zn-dependent hydrolase [Liquorilactobacillus mali]QFQ75486.1 Zn-dependent hydrolase [Liquorilactobacillus mali]